MRRIGLLLAVAGFALAVVLFLREDTRSIFRLIATAGFGLLAAALLHVLPMVLNARAWQLLFPGRRDTDWRPKLTVMSRAVWVRESVNALLPVARVGGEIASYRLLRLQGAHGTTIAAGLVIDMTLSILSQLIFALIGVGLLIAAHGQGGLVKQLLLGLLIMVPVGVTFIFVQRAGLFETATRALNKIVAGRLATSIQHSIRIDRTVRALYRRRAAVSACFAWQLTGWVAGAAEIWLALVFLGHSPSIATAVAIEALIQAVSSAAFIVPAALGVQEGAFLVIGAAFGLDGTAALALASARRLRDVAIFFPGLLAWQWAEARGPVPRWAKQGR